MDAMLQKIYDIYTDWITGQFPLVCRKGCAHCCTQSVTMTTSEGRNISAFLQSGDPSVPARENFSKNLFDPTASPSKPPVPTTNRLAAFCLNRKAPPENPSSWNMEPCLFLHDGCCSIYSVRPFGCRSFGSLQECRAGGEAVVPPLMVTVNTVFMQVIEHLDRHEGFWGSMNDILRYLTDENAIEFRKNVLPALPIPGFLLEPGEQEVVAGLLARLDQATEGELASLVRG